MQKHRTEYTCASVKHDFGKQGRAQHSAKETAAAKDTATATNSVSSSITFYPAYCYVDSPTYFRWIKLTAYEIHNVLRLLDAFSTSSVYGSRSERAQGMLLFYLNHPIQFVQAVGLVVTPTEDRGVVASFTLDDSSGSTVEIVWRKPDELVAREREKHAALRRAATYNEPRHHPRNLPTDDATGQISNDPMPQALGHTAFSDDPCVPQSPAEPDLMPLLSSLEPGTIVQAKGTVTTFRGVRQISLLRLIVLPSMSAELSLVRSRLAFQQSTLSKPWNVPQARHAELRLAAEGERQDEGKRKGHERRKKERLAKREQRHARLIAKQWETEEEARQHAASHAKRAGRTFAKDVRTRKRRGDEEDPAERR